MSFWSAETVRRRLGTGDIVAPFKADRVKYGAYEMGLGPEIFVTSGRRHTKRTLGSGEQAAIPPGQFGLLMTEETVSIPSDAIAFISIKAGIKLRGLVNVSGFHVDPGFSGRLKYSVFNAGSENVILQCGEPVFLIWFSNLDISTKEPYNGERKGQTQLTSADVNSLQGEIASPGSLKNQIDGMKLRFWALQFQIGVLLTVGTGLLIATCQNQAASRPSDRYHLICGPTNADSLGPFAYGVRNTGARDRMSSERPHAALSSAIASYPCDPECGTGPIPVAGASTRAVRSKVALDESSQQRRACHG